MAMDWSLTAIHCRCNRKAVLITCLSNSPVRPIRVTKSCYIVSYHTLRTSCDPQNIVQFVTSAFIMPPTTRRYPYLPSLHYHFRFHRSQPIPHGIMSLHNPSIFYWNYSTYLLLPPQSKLPLFALFNDKQFGSLFFQGVGLYWYGAISSGVW